jgi:hypothetical protein
MRRISLLLAAAGMAVAAPAMAAFQLTIGSNDPTVGVGNDFAGNLTALGLTRMTASSTAAAKVGVNLTQRSSLSFDLMAAESGFNNTFTAGGGAITITENSYLSWMVRPRGSLNYNAGTINNWFFTSSGNPNGPFGSGNLAFGIFFDPTKVVGGVYTSDVLYLGLDDQPGRADDNHDDIIIRVTATPFVDPTGGGVPEPASWAMLIAGFGMVGAARRRRRGVVAA